MASKVAALVRNFLQTEADALYLLAGERIFITRGTARTVAGREVVSEESFRAVVDELVPGVAAEALARKRSRLPYVAGVGLPAVEIHFATIGGVPAMMVVRPGRGPGVEAPKATAPSDGVPEVPDTPAPVVDSSAVPPASPVTPPASPPAVTAAPPATPAEAAAPRRAKGGALERLLAVAREKGASDVFLSPGERPLYRLNGTLAPAGGDLDCGEAAESFVAARAPAPAARALSGSGSARFVTEVDGAGRCLVRVARERRGTGLAVRLLPGEAHRLETLGLPDAVSRLAGPAPGLLLVAGPPGSGRTTVLAALAAHAAQGRGERVVTVEDPVEILVPPGRGSVSQRCAGPDVPSIRAGLRAAVAEDADVILAGAVPDAATAALIVGLAASGRLVLAPAPAPSLMLALQWLDAMLPEGRRLELRALLAQTFRGGLALALCRGRKGGRVAAAESLHPGSLVSELILSGGLAAFTDHLRDSSGYVTLNESLVAAVAAGLVEPREALLRSLDRPALLARLREAGAALPPELAGGPHGG